MINVTTTPEGVARLSALANDTYELAEALHAKYPELAGCMIQLWTPNDDKHPCHTCLVGEVFGRKQMLAFLDTHIPAMLRLQREITRGYGPILDAFESKK
jgi:hypothetical protein